MHRLSHWSGQQQHLQWLQVHEKCSGLKCLIRTLITVYTVPGNCKPLGWQPKGVHIGPDKLEVVASFCYLGDMLSAAGVCEVSLTTHVKKAWKKFKELYQFSLPAISLSRHTAACTALVCGAQCSMPVRFGH